MYTYKYTYTYTSVSGLAKFLGPSASGEGVNFAVGERAYSCCAFASGSVLRPFLIIFYFPFRSPPRALGPFAPGSRAVFVVREPTRSDTTTRRAYVYTCMPTRGDHRASSGDIVPKLFFTPGSRAVCIYIIYTYHAPNARRTYAYAARAIAARISFTGG
jgi:hypothetical protein